VSAPTRDQPFQRQFHLNTQFVNVPLRSRGVTNYKFHADFCSDPDQTFQIVFIEIPQENA
jgi:hypothetical protein